MTEYNDRAGRLWPPSLAFLLSLQRRAIASFSRSVAMLRSVRALAPTLALFATTVGMGLGCSSYGKEISFAASPREAAPFAAPFALCAAGAAVSFALAAAAACDAAEKLSRS